MGQIEVLRNVDGIEGLCVINLKVHGDSRGYFMETYNENDMKENGLDVPTDFHVVDDLATAAMVASGFGVCIMPELVMRDIPYDVKSYPLQPAASRMIGLAALTTQFMAPAVRTLYRHILEHCRNL